MARRSTQLFIGRLPLEARQKDLESVFLHYGRLVRCDVRYGKGMAYGFVEYDDPRDAEDAMRSEDGKKLMGSRIVVEWVRGKSHDQPVRQVSKMGDECYRCGKMGHWARNCGEPRGGGTGGGGYGGGGGGGRGGRDRFDRYEGSLSRAPLYARDRSRSPLGRRYPSPPRRRRSPSPRLSRAYRSRSRERFGSYR